LNVRMILTLMFTVMDADDELMSAEMLISFTFIFAVHKPVAEISL
jgi:hypothetical protein